MRTFEGHFGDASFATSTRSGASPAPSTST